MQCPKCTALMIGQKFGEVEVDVCSGCGGIWFDAGELGQLREMEGAAALDEGLAEVGKIYDHVERTILCPRCQVPTERKSDGKQPHVHVDWCESCHGVFTDAGEFRDLTRETVVDRVRDYFARRAG